MKGMTLIELIVATLILAGLATAALPTFYYLTDRVKVNININTLKNTLMKSRALALKQSANITVCPTLKNKCVNDWNRPISVFNDKNDNRKIDAGDSVHIVSNQLINTGFWKTRDNIANGIQFTGKGYALGSASTLVYCPNSQNYQLAQQLVLSLQGRLRQQNYLNNRGVPYATLRGLECQ